MKDCITIRCPPLVNDWGEYDAYLEQKKAAQPSPEKAKPLEIKPVTFVVGAAKEPEPKAKPMSVIGSGFYVPKFQLRKC